MRDLTAPFWLKIKALLFLLLGISSAALLMSERPTLKIALLLVLTVWSFCRLYYFAFYVIEKYLDPSYRFSGLMSCLRCLATGKSEAARATTSPGRTTPAGERRTCSLRR